MVAAPHTGCVTRWAPAGCVCVSVVACSSCFSESSRCQWRPPRWREMDSAMGSSVVLSAGTHVHTAARPQTHDSVHRNTKITGFWCFISLFISHKPFHLFPLLQRLHKHVKHWNIKENMIQHWCFFTSVMYNKWEQTRIKSVHFYVSCMLHKIYLV